MFPDVVLRETDDRMLSLLRLSKRFRWASPYTLLLEEIPRCVSSNTLKKSVVVADGEERLSGTVSVFPLSKSDDTWKAYVQFNVAADFGNFLAMIKKRDGVAVMTDKPLPWIYDAQVAASERLKDAKAASKVYPCDENVKKSVLHHFNGDDGHDRFFVC